MGARVELDRVTVRCGDFNLVDVTLSVAPDEVVAVVGHTGSGKSVLLESIAGGYGIDEGEVRIDGVDIASVPVHERGIGFVYQGSALFPHMTVVQNAMYGLRLHRVAKREAHERAIEMLERFDVADLANRDVSTISGGEAQRVALARALVLRPRLLLMDEPFSALDPATKLRMYGMVERAHEDIGCTIMLVTHDFNEAQALADRVAIVLGGRLWAVVPAAELFDAEYDPEVKQFLGIR